MGFPMNGVMDSTCRYQGRGEICEICNELQSRRTRLGRSTAAFSKRASESPAKMAVFIQQVWPGHVILPLQSSPGEA